MRHGRLPDSAPNDFFHQWYDMIEDCRGQLAHKRSLCVSEELDSHHPRSPWSLVWRPSRGEQDIRIGESSIADRMRFWRLWGISWPIGD
ncbi:hypothetical protein F4678DRAFT_448337 [Xylaria arbuscula]|nr:hypothetical protein F4678DRAFT_448337 [Xylaria arbuscula]